MVGHCVDLQTQKKKSYWRAFNDSAWDDQDTGSCYIHKATEYMHNIKEGKWRTEYNYAHKVDEHLWRTEHGLGRGKQMVEVTS